MNNAKITVFNSLSSIYWKPINFSTIDNKIYLNKDEYLFNNGMRFNAFDFLKESNDFSINRKTGFFLTNLKNNIDFLKDNIEDKQHEDLKIIKSPIGTITKGLSSTVIKRKFIGNYNQLISSTQTSFDDTDVFKFIFNDDGYVSIVDYDGYYLTTTYSGLEGGLTFQKKIIPENQAQQFDYLLGENNIILFEIDDKNLVPRFTNVIELYNSGIYALKTLNNTLSSFSFSNTMILDLLSYNKKSEQKESIKDSFMVKYLTGLDNSYQELKKDKNISDSEYNQNYLGIFPVENITENENEIEYPIIFHGLKNYQTPEYNYSLGFNYLNEQKSLRRIYDKIFTGTNQLNGLDNVYLGYTSNTVSLEFKSDTSTYFNFPATINRIPLSESGLIEDGAIAGDIPFNSDRISIKNKNYKESIPDSDQPQSIPVESNTWLCSWLSGSDDGDKLWMNRYYNAAYYSIDQALSSKAILYNEKLDMNLNYTYDIPSNMYLEPGVLYEYTRIGKNNRKKFVNYLSSSSILQITNWDSDKLKYDYKENLYGIVYLNNTENLQDTYINLDGKNHVLFPATSELLEDKKLTVSLWINVDDWTNINGYQIFGNYFDGGYGLINESSITTPIITLINNTDNRIYNLNYKFSVLSDVDVKNYNYGDYQIIQRLNDFSYWVFDIKNISCKKYNIDNEILIELNSSNLKDLSTLQEITQVEVDSNENIYIYDNITKTCIKINTYGIYQFTYNFESNVNRIEIDLNNNLLDLKSTHSTIDNYNNVWEVLGKNLYKNKKIFGNIGYVQQIICDDSDNLWILHGQDSITKIDTVQSKIYEGFPKRLGINSSYPEDPCFDYSKRYRYLNFLRVLKDINSNVCEKTTSSYEDRLIILDNIDNNIYILNSDANLKIKLNISALTKNSSSKVIANGDFTGYNYIRKFYSTKKQLSWKLKISNILGTDDRLINLPINLSKLDFGWHNFILVFDSQNGKVESYIDTIKQNEEIFDKKTYQINYKYRTSLLLGIQTLKNTTLNDIINIEDSYKFVGKISELKIYNKALSKNEIEQIFYSSNWVSNDRSLIWNTPVGERSYIEEIKYWYKMQMPGSKSKYFNINIHNLDVNNEVKFLIEEAIKNNIKKISPTNVELYNINWK
jgi:hypothetical protein